MSKKWRELQIRKSKWFYRQKMSFGQRFLKISTFLKKNWNKKTFADWKRISWEPKEVGVWSEKRSDKKNNIAK